MSTKQGTLLILNVSSVDVYIIEVHLLNVEVEIINTNIKVSSILMIKIFVDSSLICQYNLKIDGLLKFRRHKCNY